MDLRRKIVIGGTVQIVAVSGVLLWLYSQEAHNKVQQQFIEKARSVILTAESTREEVGKNWDNGIFSTEQLKAWAQQHEQNKILATVPVVVAWRSAMAKAKESGYTFRVPTFQPRNPSNKPDDFEARILKKLDDDGLSEYHEVDESINAIRFFRPVRLTQDCMICHGAPATSAGLWGNNDGLDPTGGRMEDWKPGDMHGAFEIVQSLDEADAVIAASIGKAVGMIVLALVVFGVLTHRGVNGLYRPIRRIASALTEGADQVSDASRQIAAASQTLATGSSEQSASLQHASAALQQMAAITRTNADNSRQANKSAGQAQSAADRGGVVVKQLNTAMQGISEASAEINEIIKVIGGIAFQTNLLALNAAVEAARAGEHGKGFAVVADEVRGLAGRAAEATQKINQLISNSAQRSNDGVNIASDVSAALTEILGHVRHVSGLVNNIATASEEQAKGVEQLNNAVAQLDTATQHNAGSAEESASATEELSAQAETVRSLVDEMLDLVGSGHR